MTTFSVDSIAQNGACHKLVSREVAEAQQQAHFAALDRLEPGSVERSRLANELCRQNGLVRWLGNGKALVVKIGGEQTYQHGGYCDVCDGGEWPAADGTATIIDPLDGRVRTVKDTHPDVASGKPAAVADIEQAVEATQAALDLLEKHNQGFDHEVVYQDGLEFLYSLEDVLSKLETDPPEWYRSMGWSHAKPANRPQAGDDLSWRDM